MANVTLAGFVYNNAGEAVEGATVEAFPRNTTTTSTSDTTTNSSGYWSLGVSTEGRYDVRITYGSSVRFIKYDDSAQMEELEVADFHIRNPANTFDYDIVPAAIVADRQLNLPLITATRTLIATDTNIADSENIVFGTGGDATIDYDGTDLVIAPATVGSGDVVITGGRLEVNDNEGVVFGSGNDAKVTYDGTDLVITPADVGSGDVVISGGRIEVDDDEGVVFGTGNDAKINYDGTDLVITPADVGTGDVVVSGGRIEVNDDEGVAFGTGKDATISYDGTDLIISPAVVGSGDVVITGGRIEVNDNEGVVFGTGKDAKISYDGTDLVVTPADVGSGDLKITSGSLLIADSESATFGTGKDATISYDGTDLIISPAAVGSGDVSISGGSLEVGDAEGTRYGDGQDVELRWSLADTSNHAFVIGLGPLNAAMHIANKGDIATDWAVSAEADPQLFIHCNTNPATEYLRIGNLDATNAEIDLVGGTTIKFQIDGTDEMTLTASAIDFKDNNLSNVGTVALDGGQIAFPATQVASGDANTLDDYEEGTWTPTIGDGTRNGTSESQAYSVQIGRYTKIGQQVFFTCTVTISDLGTMTTSEQAAILGLPFASENTSNSYSAISVGDMTSGNITAGHVVTGFVTYNSDNINLRLWDATGGCTDFSIAELSVGAKLVVQGHYRI